MHGFHIGLVPAGCVCTLILEGEVDLAAAPDLVEVGTLALRETAATVLVVNLAAVTFLDSSAIGALVQLRNTGQGIGKQPSLTGVTDRVRRILHITGLEAAFGIDRIDAELSDAP